MPQKGLLEDVAEAEDVVDEVVKEVVTKDELAKVELIEVVELNELNELENVVVGVTELELDAMLETELEVEVELGRVDVADEVRVDDDDDVDGLRDEDETRLHFPNPA